MLGALAIDFSAPRPFGVEERALLEALARQAAQALDRARQFEAAQDARHAAEKTRAAAEAAQAVAEAERARATEANAAKSIFLANMSHELRTPLNAIGGYAQLLELELHGPITEEQRQALGRVQAAQRHLLGLINDILNYAKLESGRVEYDVRALDVREVVQDVAPLVEPQLAAKGLAYTVRLPDTPCVVWADREKLTQVLVNLLSNATKFTEARHPATGAPGRVTVDLAVREAASEEGREGKRDDGGRPQMMFPARDGYRARDPAGEAGTPSSNRFVQVRSGYARATEGTGLGLAISRDLARGMGGDLRVRSVPGEGATFTVTLRRVIDAVGRATDRRTGEDRREDEERRSGEERRDKR